MKERPFLLPPAERPLQVILTDAWQLGDVLACLLAHVGLASVAVSTFSTGEEFLRRLARLRQEGMVTDATLYLDHKAAEKTARVLPMVRRAFDGVRFCAIHAKVMVLRGQGGAASVLTSQNQTRGNRMESYVVIDGADMADELMAGLAAIPSSEL